MIHQIRTPTSHVLAPLAVLFLIVLTTAQAQAQDNSNKKLEAAIGTLRNVESSKLSENQKETKGKEIDESWEVIRAAGKSGVSRLKQEIKKIDDSNVKDDFFKLNASTLLWQIARFDEVESITAIWNSTPLDAQYSYVFYTAFEAAMTQDVRVLPMLEACLRDDKGKVFIALHSMDLGWPLNLEFIWGGFGAKGLPILAGILEETRDPVKLQSAIVLLAEARYLNALPTIRRLARSPDKAVRSVATRCLGAYGHPQDYEFLSGGLSSKDSEEAYNYVYALYEYEDLRAVPLLIPLLKIDNEMLRREVIAALIHLVSVPSFDALQQYCGLPKTPQEKECDRVTTQLDDIGVNISNYQKYSPTQRQRVIAAARQRMEEETSTRPGEKIASHDEFLTRAKKWKENHRLTCEDGDSSCTDWRILAAATPSDLDLLIDVKGSLYGRLSDECLYEVAKIDQLIRKIGRSRYRKITGLTDKAEAP